MAVVIIGTAIFSYTAIRSANTVEPVGGVACTLEAKVCPDGSAVGREGPNCEFAACPDEGAVTSTGTTTGSTGGTTGGAGGGGGIASYQSGIRGTVLLGPICPVMRDPPDPNCADKPYPTTVSVSRVGSSAVFATAESSGQGKFELSLPPGDYTVSAKGGSVMPTCQPVTVTVGPKNYATANISCDTGIR
jgi:hypothetical protein